MKYDDQTLHELADVDLSRAQVASSGRSGSITGVSLPHWVQPGALIPPHNARRLAAQLLQAADVYDAIIDEHERRCERARNINREVGISKLSSRRCEGD